MKNSFVLFSVLYAVMNVFGATFIKQEIAKQTLSNFADFIQLLMNPKVVFGFGIIFLSALVPAGTCSGNEFHHLFLSAAIRVIRGFHFCRTDSHHFSKSQLHNAAIASIGDVNS